jgi:hypothetical protein
MQTVVPVQGVGVYHDSGTSLWHFDQLNDHSYRFRQQDYFQYPENLDSFLSSNYLLKFAGFHVPFPEERTWIERYHRLQKHVAHCFIFCSELHERTVNQLLELDHANTTIFICGTINQTFEHAGVYPWLDWFITTTHFYKHIQPTLLADKLLPQVNKSKYFDILLGCARPHRDFVYNEITKRNLNDKVIMTYHRRADVDFRISNEYIFESEGLTLLDRNYTHTVDPVEYYSKGMSLSQIVPISIYNQSYYSVVAETNWYNHFNFYTEKIVKPILAKRLFLVFAGAGYLKNLRSFGIQTFDSVIDESYDHETNDRARWTQAMDQIKFLCEQDPVKICAKIKDTVEHNQRLLLDKDWYREFSQQLTKEITPYLGSVHTVAD